MDDSKCFDGLPLQAKVILTQSWFNHSLSLSCHSWYSPCSVLRGFFFLIFFFFFSPWCFLGFSERSLLLADLRSFESNFSFCFATKSFMMSTGFATAASCSACSSGSGAVSWTLGDLGDFGKSGASLLDAAFGSSFLEAPAPFFDLLFALEALTSLPSLVLETFSFFSFFSAFSGFSGFSPSPLSSCGSAASFSFSFLPFSFPFLSAFVTTSPPKDFSLT
mmetsp:Transcript_59083/g.129575  ORF Transcript_59083/g.129575 Transcript_59083/m.129575 type:complete len:220 (-) Transcript_59083:774-1433(-)